MSALVADLERVLTEAEAAIRGAESAQSLTEVRASFLGKKGSVSGLLRGLGSLEGDERAAAGKAANEAKTQIETWANARKEALASASQDRELAEHKLDVTLPGHAPVRGHLHPNTLIEREMCSFFTEMGYGIEDGPEVETDWNNFGGLNFP